MACDGDYILRSIKIDLGDVVGSFSNLVVKCVCRTGTGPAPAPAHAHAPGAQTNTQTHRRADAQTPPPSSHPHTHARATAPNASTVETNARNRMFKVSATHGTLPVLPASAGSSACKSRRLFFRSFLRFLSLTLCAWRRLSGGLPSDQVTTNIGEWRPIRVRSLRHTHAPWGVRVVQLMAKSSLRTFPL